MPMAMPATWSWHTGKEWLPYKFELSEKLEAAYTVFAGGAGQVRRHCPSPRACRSRLWTQRHPLPAVRRALPDRELWSAYYY